MSNYPLGADNDSSAPFNETETFECSVCGIEMETDKGVCSKQCFKADML